MPRVKKSLSREQVLKKYGVRSGLEADVMRQLEDLGVEYSYEQVTLAYKKPEQLCKYTPDFVLDKLGIIVETKGRFTREDRKKHELLRKQYPEMDIRFVFTNPNAKISKTSKTSYAMWCDKLGIKWAKGKVPEEWLNE